MSPGRSPDPHLPPAEAGESAERALGLLYSHLASEDQITGPVKIKSSAHGR